MELAKEITVEQAQGISSPAIRSLVVEHISQKEKIRNGDSSHIIYGYSKFTHSKTSCTCTCVVGGLG